MFIQQPKADRVKVKNVPHGVCFRYTTDTTPYLRGIDNRANGAPVVTNLRTGEVFGEPVGEAPVIILHDAKVVL